MQRKSIGQVRRKHGAQGALEIRKRWRGSPGKPGPVKAGEVLPKGTTTGVPRAAATCIGPLSLVSRTRQTFRSVISSRKEVCPARFRIGQPARAAISWQRPRSFSRPKATQIEPARLAQTFRAAAAKFSAGQRLAGPYSAPGFI